MQPQSGSAPESTQAKRRRTEIAGEIVLLCLVGFFFAYLFVDSFNWPARARVMPRMAVFLGAPFLLARVLLLFRDLRSTDVGGSSEPNSIMDVGFREVDDGQGGNRFARFTLFIVGTYLFIWLIGLHVALPLAIALYLWKYAGLKWLPNLAIVGILSAFIFLVYDVTIASPWPRPIIHDVFPFLPY